MNLETYIRDLIEWSKGNLEEKPHFKNYTYELSTY